MIEQTLCDLLVQRNRQLAREVDRLEHEVADLRKLNDRNRRRAFDARRGRDLWRLRALR